MAHSQSVRILADLKTLVRPGRQICGYAIRARAVQGRQVCGYAMPEQAVQVGAVSMPVQAVKYAAMQLSERLASRQRADYVEVVVPVGSRIKSKATAEKIELLAVESLYAGMAVKKCGYPMLVFRLPQMNVDIMKTALAKVLAKHRVFAGRLDINTSKNFTGHVSLNDLGVPFSVAHSDQASAPNRLEETEMCGFSSLPNPSKLMAGCAPVMMVEATIFKDGSGVLGVSRTHAVADGSSMWTFIADWAAAARGEPLAPPSLNAPAVREELCKYEPHDWDHIAQTMEDEMGVVIKKMRFTYSLLMGMNRIFDLIFFAGLAPQPQRTRVFFSHADLEKLKAAATPPAGTPGDGWVTTQDALAAHILLSFGRVLLPETKDDAATGVQFILDVRQKLGLPKDAFYGIGFSTHICRVERLLQKNLSEVAVAIHEELKNFTTEKVKKTHGPMMWVLRRGLAPILPFLQRRGTHPKKGKYDLLLQLNNQSKRVLPDFGMGGGLASAVLSNAGPCHVLPADGGVEVFFVDEVFQNASAEKKAQCIKALAEIPEPPKVVHEDTTAARFGGAQVYLCK